MEVLIEEDLKIAGSNLEEGIVKFIFNPTREAFYNNESQWGVYHGSLVNNLTPEYDIFLNQDFGTLTVTGCMPRLNINDNYTLSCTEAESKYGKQYTFISLEVDKLSTSDEQINFLSTLVTEKQLKAISSVYKYPIDEIINDTFDYNKISGIGEFTYKAIKEKVSENQIYFALLSKLGAFGISFTQVKKLYDKYKNADTAVAMLEENPYILMDLSFIGFKKADSIALKMGVSEDDPRRIIACIEHFLDQDTNNGHTWCHIDVIESSVCDYINYDIFLSRPMKDYINDNNKFIIIEDKICLRRDYETEKDIAKILTTKNHENILNVNVEKFIEKQESIQGFEYDEKQKEAIYSVAKNNITILTGCGGSGKTTVVNGMLNMFDENLIDYILLSPSAKASKVLMKYTKREASTIHRGLNWTPDGFSYNEDSPLPFSVVVVDEVSMVGIYLFQSLLKAIDDKTKIILIGDNYQLPSIEAGNILDDMIGSNKFPCIQLTKIFRQAEKSGIINIATKTRLGEYFVSTKDTRALTFGENKDTHLIPCKKEFTINRIIKSYKRLIDLKYTDDDIMVALPTRKNSYGTVEVNKIIQEIVNPFNGGAEIRTKNYDGDIVYREGDKVIHIVNDYKAEWFNYNNGSLEPTDNVGIFNGDIGRIIKVENDDKIKKILVDYGDKVIVYYSDTFNHIEHAWALTIHKLQGDSSRVVIIGFDTRHFYMAKRNLLYTAITRAKEMLIMCCDPYIINKAISNNETVQKRTFLSEFL